MKQNVNFPYDVIIDSKSFFKRSEIEDDNFYMYDLFISDEIFNKKDFFQKNLELIVEVNCSATMYRECFRGKIEKKLILKLERKNIFGSFSADVLIVFNSIPNREDLQLKKGMPYAHLGSHKFEIISKTHGLITFTQNEHDDNIFYSFSDNVIKVNIPKKNYVWLLANKNKPLIKNILKSQFAQIALIEACKKLQDNSNDHLQWQKELLKRWRKSNISEYPEDFEILSFVKKILNNPSEELLDILIDKQNE